MPRVGFEPTTPEFERAQMVHALDRAASATGTYLIYTVNLKYTITTCDFRVGCRVHRLSCHLSCIFCDFLPSGNGNGTCPYT
jgi:hypothetical protein